MPRARKTDGVRFFAGVRPDITPAQVTAVLGWIGAQAVAFGWLDGRHEQTLVSGGATIVAAALKIADAYLRGQRNVAAAAQAAPPTTVAPSAFTATITPTPPQ